MKEAQQLFRRYLENQCSEEEVDKVLDWLETEEGKQYADSFIQSMMLTPAEGLVPVSSKQIETAFQSFKKTVVFDDQPKIAVKSINHWYWMAASFFILVSTMVYFLINQPSIDKEKVAITSNNRQLILLPDSSEIVLYENAKIRYNNVWKEGDPREVWLEGSGYFSIKHKHNHAPFTVYTKDSLNVKVLGTKFEISSFENNSRVTLEEGKVQVAIKKAAFQKEQILLPGEMFDYNVASSQLISKKVDASLITFRSKNVITLNNTSFLQLADLIQNAYGYQLVVADQELLQQQFSGTLPANSLQETIQSIALLIDMKYVMDKKEVRFFK